jgi:hypothetical protein
MTEIENPIIAAIARSSMARPSHDESPRGFTITFSCDTFSPQVRSWVRHRFDAKTRDEIGTVILCALANGDDTIEGIVRDARKAADRMFHRNHEPKLLEETVLMISEGCGVEFDEQGRAFVNVERLKREVEKRFHNGEKLPRYRWNHVRAALNWPKSATGAAAANYKAKRKPRRRRRQV